MDNDKKQDSAKLSRRNAIKAAGGILAVAGMGTLGISAQTPQPAQAMKATDSKATALTSLPDGPEVYATLAAWLLVTSDNASFATMTACDIEKQTGIPHCFAQEALDRASNHPTIYGPIRAEFTNFRTALGYGGPACPRRIDPLKTVTGTPIPNPCDPPPCP